MTQRAYSKALPELYAIKHAATLLGQGKKRPGA
jgi:hypothetical protein